MQINEQKKDTQKGAFPAFRRLALRVLLVVLVATYLPVVRLEGLFAVGKILLREERCLVRRHQRQVLAAGFDGRCYRSEASASAQLIRARRSAALYFLTQVQAVAIRVFGSRYAVGRKQHFCTTVLTILTGF